jgi:hypothetical protein
MSNTPRTIAHAAIKIVSANPADAGRRIVSTPIARLSRPPNSCHPQSRFTIAEPSEVKPRSANAAKSAIRATIVASGRITASTPNAIAKIPRLTSAHQWQRSEFVGGGMAAGRRTSLLGGVCGWGR